MVDFWYYVCEFFNHVGEFWTWLITPIQELGGWRPISVIGISGVSVILIFWIVKLINPLS